MKKADIFFALGLIIFFGPFFICDSLFQFYKDANALHPYVLSYIKFALLATLGEVIGLRIREGVYNRKGFGILPRAFVWGFLGILIKMGFTIFGSGAPVMLASMGVEFPAQFGGTGGILKHSILETTSWLHVLAAFSVSTTLNFFFAPFFMTLHKITDEHINNTGGSFWKFISTPMPFGHYMQTLNWGVMWNFVFKKTIILFWIPAQTVTFMLNPEYRILFAAFLGIVLGVFMAIAALKSKS